MSKAAWYNNIVRLCCLLIILISCCDVLHAQKIQNGYFVVEKYTLEGYPDINLYGLFRRTTEPEAVLLEVDTLAMVEELLSFEGDTRPSGYVVFRCVECSFIPSMHNMPSVYSVQIAALDWINRLFFPSSYTMYSPFMVLVDEANKNKSSMDGSMVIQAFQCYRQWFARIREIGLEQFRKLQQVNGKIHGLDYKDIEDSVDRPLWIDPLYDCPVRWMN